MPSRLEILIAIHYSQSEANFPIDYPLKTSDVKQATENLLRNGLIEEHGNNHYRKSDALHRWIKALEAVPFPVIE